MGETGHRMHQAHAVIPLLEGLELDLAREIEQTLCNASAAWSSNAVQDLVAAAFAGVDQELSLGYAICRGGAQVLAQNGDAAADV